MVLIFKTKDSALTAASRKDAKFKGLATSSLNSNKKSENFDRSQINYSNKCVAFL